jgi:16S rRNA (adenine1518-N6/adenine1519-N6)-dimethyltransferase
VSDAGTPHPSTVLKALEQRARRRFGQNFLVRPEVPLRIAALAGVGPGERVLEIGPGLGALTRALADTGARVRAVELDRDLASYLQATMPDLDLVLGDAMKVDLEEVAPGEGWRVCANLPYNVATPLLHRLLDKEPPFARLVLMFQKEVAARLAAPHGSRTYGSLSVRVQARAEARLAMTLPPGAFHPRPKVDSAVVVLTPHREPRFGPAGREGFDRAVKAGFSQRRKTLENALKATYGRDLARAACEETVGAGRRAETLNLEQWQALAARLTAGP